MKGTHTLYRKRHLEIVLQTSHEEDKSTINCALSMLDTIGTFLEKYLKTRLTLAVEEHGGLSERQYGFRKGLSTIEVVKEVITKCLSEKRRNHYS